jgi:hypothetical protein
MSDRLPNDGDHVYDGAGICALCNRCTDPGCCPQRPCDRRTVYAILRAAKGNPDTVRKRDTDSQPPIEST